MSFLSRALDEWRARPAAPPVAAAVRVDGVLAWSSVPAVRAIAPGPPRLPTYSILKTVTAIAALRLQEQGRLEIAAPVRRYLADAPVDPRATVADLLRHTSGLPDYGPLPEYHAAVRATPGTPWTDDAFLAVATRLGPLFAPGQGWSYSNIGYLLLRRLIEQRTGGAFAAAIDALVVRPVALADTFVARDVEDWVTCVPGYGAEVDASAQPVDVRARYHPGWCAPGVAVSTPADMTRVYDALFTGELLTPASLSAMLTMVPVPGVHTSVVTPMYGLGIHADHGSPFGRNYGHGGGGPGYSLSATVYPDTPLGRVAIAVGVTASSGPQADDCERHLMAALLRTGPDAPGEAHRHGAPED